MRMLYICIIIIIKEMEMTIKDIILKKSECVQKFHSIKMRHNFTPEKMSEDARLMISISEDEYAESYMLFCLEELMDMYEMEDRDEVYIFAEIYKTT